MIRIFLPLLISSFVFIGTWSVSAYIRMHRVFESQRYSQPKGRPVLSRPVVIKR